MGVLKWVWKQATTISPEEQMAIQASMTAQMIADEQKKAHTCKLCKRIFSEGVPYHRTMFGKPKNYICVTCAKSMGLTN